MLRDLSTFCLEASCFEIKKFRWIIFSRRWQCYRKNLLKLWHFPEHSKFLSIYFKCDNFRLVFLFKFHFCCWLSHLLHSALDFFLHKYVACNFEHFKNDFFKIYSTKSEWTGKNVTTIRECIFWTCRTLNWMRSIFLDTNIKCSFCFICYSYPFSFIDCFGETQMQRFLKASTEMLHNKGILRYVIFAQ